MDRAGRLEVFFIYEAFAAERLGSMAGTKWNLEAEFIQSCNCDYGCPCNFNALPTRSNCEALIAYKVRKGKFGTTNLDGVKWAWGLWWPAAIHQGNGAGRVYVDSKATDDQKRAVEAITSGKNGGGVFTVFPSTFTTTYPARTARIDFTFRGNTSRFRVEGVGEVKSDDIRNPVTGEKFSGQILLPGGIQWTRGEVTSVDWWLRDPQAGWDMAHAHAAGFVALLKMNEKGPIRK
ncbi:MAG TPA: DUF1326 domain-containing protein [Thermoplasmata archaeon]|nr:DUF1326 domain-containing protein [Thermoplasmata archaeon]